MAWAAGTMATVPPDGLSNLIDLTMTDLGHGLEGTRRLRLLRAPTGIALSQALTSAPEGPER
jgi:hypothetical protein